MRNAYLPALKKLGDTPTGRQKAEWLLTTMRDNWATVHGLKEPSQQVGCMDQVRRMLKNELGEDHWLLQVICFPSETYAAINELKQARVAQRNEGVKYLDKPDEIVAKAVRLLESPEWAHVAAGLAVLTGRRVSELLASAEFEKKSQWSVIFRGAAKRGSEKGLAFEIPTLTTADRIIQALAMIRRELPQAVGMSPHQLNRSYEPAVARVCDEVFRDLVPTREGEGNLYTHLFRAIYASIATVWYCPPAVNPEEFKAAIQGHFKVLNATNPSLRRSLAAGRHYADYEVADAPRRGIKLGVAGIEPIEMFKIANSVEVGMTTKKTTRLTPSSVRIWRQDKQKLELLFERLGLDTNQGKQEDRMRALLDWALLSLTEEDSSDNEAIATLPATPEPDPLRSDIQELVGALKSFTSALPSLLKGAKAIGEESPIPAPTRNPQAKPQGERKIRGKAQTSETLNFLLSAIMDHNNSPGRRHDDKWEINFSILRRWVKSKPAIEAFLEMHREAIQNHHKSHGIEQNHNYRHRRKNNITDIIQIPDHLSP